MTSANKTKWTLTIGLIAAVMSVCASPGQVTIKNHDHVTRNHQIVRSSVTAVQASILMARSFQIDPVNRPVANAMSLGSYVLKSTTGLVRRVAIGTAQFPSLETQPIQEISQARGMDLSQWEKDLDQISGRTSLLGTIDFLVDGEEYFPRMLEAVRNAKDSIDIRTYIFDNDDYAAKIADELRSMSNSVDVRVMFDGIGNLLALQAHPESMPANFNTPISMERYLEEESKVQVRTLSNPWLTGDHTKTTIIDKTIAFVGGMNIGREYRYDWHDLMMEVGGPIVDQLQYDTNKAWARASIFGDLGNFFAALSGKKNHADPAGYPIRALYTRNFDSQIYLRSIGSNSTSPQLYTD